MSSLIKRFILDNNVINNISILYFQLVKWVGILSFQKCYLLKLVLSRSNDTGRFLIENNPI